MIGVLYECMAIPESCRLAKRVFKKLFFENAKLGVTDKKAFSEDIDTVTWQYALKPGTIPIKPYEDDQREYQEIQVLQVNLKTRKRTARIAEIMHRAIPYPLVIVFACEKECAISTAHKRFSQAEKGAIVAEDFVITDWLDLAAPRPAQRAFFESLAIADLQYTHLFAFYSAIVDRLIALNCARLTGNYRLESDAEMRETRRRRLAACHELEGRIAECRAAIKKETQFNRQVELNCRIKLIETHLAIIIRQL